MRTKLVLSLFLAAGMLAVVQAQPGGRGGFGGGFGAAISNVTFLVMNKAVQEDLKMSDDQVSKVKDWAKDFAEKAKEIRKDKGVETPTGGRGKGNGGGGGKGGNKGGGGAAPTTEQLEKIAAANSEINRVAYKELGDVLKADQIKRLKEIQRQARGVEAFSDSEVADALKLSDSQKMSLKSLGTDMGKEVREIRTEAFKNGGGGGGGKGGDPEAQKALREKTEKVQKEYMGKAVDVLNDDQKKTWKSLTGETFDISKLSVMTLRRKD